VLGAAVGAAAVLLYFGVGASREGSRPVDWAPSIPAAGAPGAGRPEQAGVEHERIEAAIEAGRRRLDEAEAAHGPESPEAAAALSATAQALWGLEAYAAARPFAERALSMRVKTMGESCPEVAASHYQVGELRRATGDYAGALRDHRQALAIWERTPGPHTPDVAAVLHYLGVLYFVTGDLVRAREHLDRALALREKVFGRAGEPVAATLMALAGVSIQSGEVAAAGEFVERAQGIWERTLGPGHPHVARCLTSRAGMLAAAGDRDGARALLERALDIRARAFGPEHHLVARSLVDLAGLIGESGASTGTAASEAESLYRRALEIQERSLGHSHPDVAETLAALARLQWRNGAVEPALEGALEAEAIARANFRRSARDLTLGEALRFASLRTSGIDVALSIVAGAGSRGTPEEIRRVADALIRSRNLVLDEEARAAHAARAQDTADPAPVAAEIEPGLREVLGALPASSALVSYARHPGLEAMQGSRPAGYLAFIIRAGADTPVAIPLGDAETIDALINAWRLEVSIDPRRRPGDAAEQAYDEVGSRLRAAIWDPLTPALSGVDQVFVVPDGAINLVSLATLPAARGTYLAETGPLVHYLSAERDLVRPDGPRRAGRGILVLGGPDFDALPEPVAAGPGRTTLPACTEFSTLDFEPLAGSLLEADEVARLWSGRDEVTRLTGAAAGEAEFKRRAPGRRILHLATHAFVLSDRCGPEAAMPGLPEGLSILGDRPLLRSGLALSGANRRAAGPSGSMSEDGILTAEEIAALDLTGVEWAVLSGCDTGVGSVVAGEGIVGLRRAFEVAGARTLIMSLWPVDDGAARVWMRSLYEQRLAGRGTAESVRDATLGILESQRRRGGTTHPYFWGGFVAAGDWRSP